MTAKVLRKCPACGANKLERLIGTGAGVIFKGSGFYQTDYRGESYDTAKKQDSGNGGSTSESKQDTPPTDSTKANDTTAPSTSGSKSKSQSKSQPKSQPKSGD